MTNTPRRVLAVSVLFAGVGALANAAADTKFAAPSATDVAREMGAGAGALQIFGSLALVVATILVIGWVARRLKSIPQGRAGRMRVVDDISLGAKERAVLLQVDGTNLVLGVGDGRVTILHRSAALPESLEVSTGPSDKSTGATNFVDVLKRSIGK